MATKYVSQTATNGYQVGNDANNGSTKSLAKLTLESAISEASSGDTIVINDGEYVAASFYNITKSLTINPENPYGTTLKRTGAQIRVLNINVVGAVTLGALVLDAEESANTSAISSSTIAGGNIALTLNKTKLKNPGSGAAAASFLSVNLNLKVNDVVLDGACYSGGVNATALQAGHIDIDGLSVDNSGTSGAIGPGQSPVLLIAASAGPTMQIRRCSGVWKSVGSSHGFIITRGMRGIIERNRGMRVIGTDISAAIIKCENNAVQADNIVIRYNQGVNECQGHYLILVGTDSSGANNGKTSYPHVYRNDVSGSSAASLMHGIMLGNIKGGVCFANRVRKAGIPLLSKLQTERAYFDDNDVDDSPTGVSGCMRAKGSANTDFVGNRIRLSTGNMNIVAVVNQDPTVPTFCSGVSFIGNDFYSPVQIDSAAVVGSAGDSSDAAFMLNNWMAPSYGTLAWQLGATYYGTLAEWIAAKEPTATAADPSARDHRFWHIAYEPLKISALSAVAPHLLSVEK